jgi:hypothetical protein
LRRGIEAMLRMRFGEEGLKLMPEIREVHEEDKLEAILTALETGASLDETRRIWSPAQEASDQGAGQAPKENQR